MALVSYLMCLTMKNISNCCFKFSIFLGHFYHQFWLNLPNFSVTSIFSPNFGPILANCLLILVYFWSISTNFSSYLCWFLAYCWPISTKFWPILWLVFDQFLTSFWPVSDQFLTSCWPVVDQLLTSFWSIFTQILAGFWAFSGRFCN